MEPRDEVAALARAIADRLPVDWQSLQSSGDEVVCGTARQLKVIANIAALHREAAGGGVRDRAWGAFRIVNYVGHGSYGDVYRAIGTRLDREVALKLLRAAGAPVGELGAEVLEEARLLARVRHPNVVTIHGADRIDGRVGLWMEFIEGRTLERILQEDGLLSPSNVASVCLDVCRALQAVHDADLLHRDIKAQNVMREAGGRHVLMDFGAGRHAATGGLGDITGTPLCIAPEVLEGAPASSRSDIYSVGVLLFHLATGRYPVEGRNLDELRARHQAGERVELRSLRPQLTGALVDVIQRALKKEPSERFDSAQEMADVAARIVSPQPVVRRRTTGAFVAAVLALAVAGAAPEWLINNHGETTTGLRTRLLWDDAVDLSGTTSANGRLLSFVDWSTGELGVRDLLTGQSRVLPIPDEARKGLTSRTPISPDGEWVAYTWEKSLPASAGSGRAVELGITSTRGEAVVSLTRWPPRYAEPFGWSPDSRSIAVMMATRDASAIEIVPLDGGAPRRVVSLDDEADALAFSPDGGWLAFHSVGPTPAVFVVRADGSSVKPVSIANATALLAWTHDGRLLFTREREEATELFAVPMVDGRAAGEPAKIETVGDMGRLMPMTVAPGRGMPALGFAAPGTLIHGRVRLATDAVTVSIDPTTGAVGPERVGRAIAAYGLFGLAGGIRYAPDGARVLYTVTQGSVLIQESDGRTRTVVPQLDAIGRIEWAPDGRSLIVGGRRDATELGVYRVDLGSGAASLLMPGPRRPWAFGIAPDGQTLYYSRSGEPEAIIARDLRTGVERTVGATARTIAQLRVSPDGRLLVVVTFPTVEIVDLASGRVVRTINRSANGRFWGADWSPDAKHVFATVGYGDSQPWSELWRIPVDGGDPVRHRLAAPARGGWMRADGREFSVMRWEERNQVWSLEHFLP
jgi:serine/threonine-protein kinase